MITPINQMDLKQLAEHHPHVVHKNFYRMDKGCLTARVFFGDYEAINNSRSPFFIKDEGIRCYGWITSIFVRCLKLFCLSSGVETLETSDGKKIYMNKNSWSSWQRKRLSQEFDSIHPEDRWPDATVTEFVKKRTDLSKLPIAQRITTLCKNYHIFNYSEPSQMEDPVKVLIHSVATSFMVNQRRLDDDIAKKVKDYEHRLSAVQVPIDFDLDISPKRINAIKEILERDLFNKKPYTRPSEWRTLDWRAATKKDVVLLTKKCPHEVWDEVMKRIGEGTIRRPTVVAPPQGQDQSAAPQNGDQAADAAPSDENKPAVPPLPPHLANGTPLADKKPPQPPAPPQQAVAIQAAADVPEAPPM